MAVDKNDGVWVHNLNTNKLIRFDMFLNIDQQWDCSSQDLFTGDFGNSNLATNHDGSQVYWYRGSHECVVIDVDSNKFLEEFDYVTDECQVMSGVYPIKNQSFLLTVSNNQAGEDAKLVVFDTKKSKIASKHTYSSLTQGTSRSPGEGTTLQSHCVFGQDTRLCLAGLNKQGKSLVSVFSLTDLKLLAKFVAGENLYIRSLEVFDECAIFAGSDRAMSVFLFDEKRGSLSKTEKEAFETKSTFV